MNQDPPRSPVGYPVYRIILVIADMIRCGVGCLQGWSRRFSTPVLFWAGIPECGGGLPPKVGERKDVPSPIVPGYCPAPSFSRSGRGVPLRLAMGKDVDPYDFFCFCSVETGMNGGSHPNYEKRYLFAWGGSPVQGLDTARWGKLLDMI